MFNKQPIKAATIISEDKLQELITRARNVDYRNAMPSYKKPKDPDNAGLVESCKIGYQKRLSNWAKDLRKFELINGYDHQVTQSTLEAREKAEVSNSQLAEQLENVKKNLGL
jgi:hypothetical protein